jgi:hypothetical protein
MELSDKKAILQSIFGDDIFKRINDDTLKLMSPEVIQEFISAVNVMENNTNPLLEQLFMKADETLLPMQISCPSLCLRGKVSGSDVDFILDTGAQQCVIDYNFVKSIGIEDYIDKSAKAVVSGIGQGISHGIIPYIELEIEGDLYPVTFIVMELPKSSHTKVLLGLNFLMYYNAKMDLEKRKLYIMGHEKNLIIKEGH